jgi:non-specific serine/threonine protein kinase
MAWAALRQADYTQARELLGESIQIRKEIGDKGGTAWCLERLAELAGSHAEWERAGRLLGAAHTLRDSVGSVVDTADRPDYERTTKAVRAELGEAAFSEAWEAGRGMALRDASMEQIIAYAQQFQVAAARVASTKNGTAVLTRRERVVAALIAQSKTNAEIAEAMVITKRTVETHIASIRSKLGFTSRVQIASWAIKKDLASLPD